MDQSVQESESLGQGEGVAGRVGGRSRLIKNGTLADSLSKMIRSGGEGLRYVPTLVAQCIEGDCWREFLVEKTGEVVSFDRFEAFVTESPPEGLGAEVRLLKNLCRDDPKATDLIDRATQGRQGERTDLFDIVDNVNEVKRPTGNARDAALRRLRKDRPDLHGEVISGRLSANAAMIEAGFRKAPTPLEVGKKAWAKMSEAEKQEFRRWIR